jgi:hypothetical protein
MTLKTTYGPKNLRHTGLGPYVGARMVGPVCRTPMAIGLKGADERVSI